MTDEKEKKEVEKEDAVLAEITAELKKTQEELEASKKSFEAEKRALTKQILDGGKVQEDEVVDVEALKKKKDDLSRHLRGYETLSNREIWQTSLELRDVTLKLTGKDDYQPDNSPNPGHIGERVAQEMRTILEEANGSDAMFNALYQERIRDNPAYANLARPKRK